MMIIGIVMFFLGVFYWAYFQWRHFRETRSWAYWKKAFISLAVIISGVFLYMGGYFLSLYGKEDEIFRRKAVKNTNNLISLDSISLDSLISKVSREYGVDPLLIEAMIIVESGKDPFKVGSKGEIGLMQIYPKNFGWLLYDPELNIRAGIKELLRWLAVMGDIRMAVASYNGGFKGNQAYLKKVESIYNKLKEENKQKEESKKRKK